MKKVLICLLAVMISFSITGKALAQRGTGTTPQRGKRGNQTVSSLKAGVKAVRSGNFQKAVPLLKKAATNNPNTPMAHYYLGVSYMKMKKNIQAKNSFKKAKQLFQSQGNKKGVKAVNQLLQRIGSK